MRLNRIAIALLAAYVLALGTLVGAGPKQESGPPPLPNIFTGRVFIGGTPAADGIEIFARIDTYQTNVARPGIAPEDRPISLTKNGKYTLQAQPPTDRFVNKTITFHATAGFGDVQAEETAKFQGGIQVNNGFDLHFPEAPLAGPTPEPTPTLTPTPTPLPIPDLPIPGDPSVPNLSRIALLAGIAALAGGGVLLFLMRRRKAL